MDKDTWKIKIVYRIYELKNCLNTVYTRILEQFIDLWRDYRYNVSCRWHYIGAGVTPLQATEKMILIGILLSLFNIEY